MPRTHCLIALLALLSVLPLTACSHSTGDPATVVDDGGTTPVLDAPLTPDSEFYPWDGSVALFGPCTAKEQCRYATGAQCLTSYPGGLCSIRCDLGLDCGFNGICVQNVCLPACSANGNCVTLGGMCAEATYCVPSCGAGAPQCPAGAVCDPYAAACTTSPTVDAGDNGAPCASDDQCLGFCINDGVSIPFMPLVVGYLGGMCASYARAPDPGVLVDGGLLPTSNCPPGSVIVPAYTFVAGDMILCLPACQSDSECRPGYACWMTDGVTTYADGYCAPFNCMDGVHHCPPPSRCASTSAFVPATGACRP
jgi:hypothetical protein